MSIWPTPNEPFKNLSDVEKFLRTTLVEINDILDSMEEDLQSDDDGVTYEWVTERINEKMAEVELKVEELETRVKELEENVSSE